MKGETQGGSQLALGTAVFGQDYIEGKIHTLMRRARNLLYYSEPPQRDMTESLVLVHD